MAKKPSKAQAQEGGDGAIGPAKKGAFSNRLVLGGIAAAVLAAAGGAAWELGLFGGKSEGVRTAVAEADAPKPATFVDLPEMTVNLDSQDHAQYLRVKIALEVGEPASASGIQPMMPRVLDTFQTYLRELRPSDLEGSAGLFRLKEELTKRVNVAVFPAKVDAVLFKEIVVQ